MRARASWRRRWPSRDWLLSRSRRRQRFGDDEDDDDDDDDDDGDSDSDVDDGDDIYIMMQCLSVTKKNHFLLGVSCIL